MLSRFGHSDRTDWRSETFIRFETGSGVGRNLAVWQYQCWNSTQEWGLPLYWKTKAALFHAFDTLPLGHTAYALSQQYLTRSLPRPKARFPEYIARLEQHIDHFKAHGRDLNEASYFEFGAGWDLFFPIGMAAAGMRDQSLFDLTPLAKTRWINHVIEVFRTHTSRYFVRELPRLQSLQDLKRIGISYTAPADARKTGLTDDSIDLISTTSVLEHVPRSAIESILIEIKRIARPGAILSMIIDYEDHYGQRTPHIDIYNFLQFSAFDWVSFNPDIHYQNRLRHRDYLEMFEKAGFESIYVSATRPDDWEQRLQRIAVHREFSAIYTPEDLSITQGVFLLRC